LINDGPYVFSSKGVIETYLIDIPTPGKTSRIIKDQWPAQNGAAKTLTCHLDNTLYNTGMENFDFSLYPHEFFTDNPHEYDQPGEILAMSDIEGNFYALQSLLTAHGVMDKQARWTYGTNHLVINGDLIDRSNNALACLWLIYKLDAEAKLSGGAVHYILGNHELMNFESDFRYVNSKYKSSPKRMQLYEALFSTNSVLGNWIRTKNSIEKIGNYLFVHAGISPELLASKLLMEEVNKLLREYLCKEYKGFLTEEEKLLTGDDGPLWYRGLVEYKVEKRLPTKEHIARTLEIFNCEKIIIGHTVVPDFTRIWNGRVIVIDIYQPSQKSSVPAQACLIKGDQECNINDKGIKGAF